MILPGKLHLECHPYYVILLLDSTNFLVNSIMTNTYTLNQAEYFIKFSKEAKAYVKVREKERVDKVHQFVKVTDQ